MSMIAAIARIFGEKALKGLSEQSLALSSLKKLLALHPMASLFDYDCYDEESGLYVNQGSLACLIEVAPFMGFSTQAFETLHSFVTDVLPEEAVFQCLLWGSPKIHPALSAWRDVRAKRGGVYAAIADRRLAYLEKSAFETLLNKKDYYLRDIRIFISITASKTQALFEKLAKVKSNLLSTINAMGGCGQAVLPDSFISLCYDWINPQLTVSSTPKTWDKRQSLQEQIVAAGNNLKVRDDALFVQGDKWEIRSFHVETLPLEWLQQQMGQIIGDEEKEFLQTAGQFFVNVVFQKMAKDRAKRKAGLKQTTSARNAMGQVSKLMPILGYIAKDWERVNQRLNTGKSTLVTTYCQVVSLSPTAKADAAEAQLKTVFQSAGWVLKRDKYISLLAFLSLFPMQVGSARLSDLKHLKRTRTLLSENVVNVLPLQGEWKGVGEPCLLLAGRRGQVCWWNPFASQEGNYNVAVTGKSRSGKSVLLQELATGVVGAGGRAFIFDIGRSFEKACKYLGGSFIEFSRDSAICLNPFTQVDNINDALEMLNLIFASMASAKGDLSEIESAFLEEAIKNSWKAYGKQADVTAVSDCLKAHRDKRANDIGIMLYPYTQDGHYGRFFNGACTLDFKNPYIVLELEELKSMKKLQSVVLMMLMYHVTEAMYHGGRKERIICIIDEAWDLLSGKLGAQFIETGYRRAAKYNGAFVSGTQSLADYDKNASAIACKENSDSMLILTQKADTIDKAEKLGQLDMDRHLKHLLKSVKTIHEEYAEVCIKTPSGYSVNRLLLDDFSNILFSSKASVFAAVKQLTEEKGLSLEAAIAYLADKKRP